MAPVFLSAASRRIWAPQVLWRILPAEHGSAAGPGGLPPPAAGSCLPGAGSPGPGCTGSPEGPGGRADPETLQPPLGMSRVEILLRPQQHVCEKQPCLLLKCVFFGRTLEKKIKQMLKLFIVFINLTHANVSDPSHRHFDLQRQETRTFPDGFCFFDCWLNKLSNLFLYLLCYS